MLRAAFLAVLLAAPATADIVSARYVEPTARYDHGVLGDLLEWGGLEMRTDDGRLLRVTLPGSRVFEDTEPRLADLDGDGDAEVIVVETLITEGAQLAIYDETGKIAATPHIGTTHRWLAPLGAADLTGDGRIELAYVDRPHLSKILRIWSFHDGRLVPLLDVPGLTNHRIGDKDIAGGIRDCGSGTELITADAAWSRVIGTDLRSGRPRSRDLGPIDGGRGFARALACQD